MPSDRESQLRQLFRDHGMEPKDVRRNESLDRFEVSVQADGSDERFHRDVHEIGSEGPVDYQIDYGAVRGMQSVIDGKTIPSGVVSVEEMESEYFLITVA